MSVKTKFVKTREFDETITEFQELLNYFRECPFKVIFGSFLIYLIIVSLIVLLP